MTGAVECDAPFLKTLDIFVEIGVNQQLQLQVDKLNGWVGGK